MQQILIATGNKGKLREFARILAPYGIEAVGMDTLHLDLEIEETGATFAENAAIKAMALHEATGRAVLADDSGLCVDALGGRPGVHSARYGGEALPHPQKIELLLEELEQVKERTGRDDRSACYKVAICLVTEAGTVHTFHGICPGHIGRQCRGEGGFGYDPIFCVGEKTMAQLTDGEKDAISHRGKALRELSQALPDILTTDSPKG